MRYTITIKDNKTNEILVDEQADCIIGAVTDPTTTVRLLLSDARKIEIIECARKAFESVKQAIKTVNSDIKELTDD